jgi:hypothetical protein
MYALVGGAVPVNRPSPASFLRSRRPHRGVTIGSTDSGPASEHRTPVEVDAACGATKGCPGARIAAWPLSIWEPVVPYALFENDERLTRPFRTEREVWEAAERADLTVSGADGERILDNNFEIRPCDATPDELTVADQNIRFPDHRLEQNSSGSDSADPDVPLRQLKTKETP